MADNLLSLMTFFPLLGMLVVLFIPRENGSLLKSATLVVTLITFVLSLPLAFNDVFTVSGGMHYRTYIGDVTGAVLPGLDFHTAWDGRNILVRLQPESR